MKDLEVLVAEWYWERVRAPHLVHSWDNLPPKQKEGLWAIARSLLSQLQENGVVQLAEDQTVPSEGHLPGRAEEYFGPGLVRAREAGYEAGTEAMRKAGFVRVQPLLPASDLAALQSQGK